jgi:predicted outer membrane protein
VPALCIASDSVQENAVKDDHKITARNNVRNSLTDVTAKALSRYYGARSPQGETDLIIDQVQDLIDSGNLSQKTGTYLQVMLKTAKSKFDRGNDDTAINRRQVFIHLVNKFAHDGQISKEDGQKLIENAQFLVEALQA